MKIFVLPKHQISGFIADHLEREIAQNPHAILGMTTGSTPLKLGIYQEWINRAKSGSINFSRVKFVNPDELLDLPISHPETYRMYMKKHLFSGLCVSSDQTLIPDSGTENADEECRHFERCLNELGGIDWQLMGLGLNGHMAFIEPADAIPSTTYVVELDEQDCVCIEESSFERIITQAISVGLSSIMKAKSVVMTVVGENKADIVAQAFGGPITTRVPASFLQLHMNATIILDKEAASKMPKCYLEKLERGNGYGIF